MDSPKIKLLIDMGTNKLKEGLGKFRSMINVAWPRQSKSSARSPRPG